MNNSKLLNYRWQLCVVMALLSVNMFGGERNKLLYGSIAVAGALTAGAGCMDRYSSTPSKLALIGGGAAALYGIYRLSRNVGGDGFSFPAAKKFFSKLFTFGSVQQRRQDQPAGQQTLRLQPPDAWRGLRICVCKGACTVVGEQHSSEGDVEVNIGSVTTEDGRRYVNGIEACCTHCNVSQSSESDQKTEVHNATMAERVFSCPGVVASLQVNTIIPVLVKRGDVNRVIVNAPLYMLASILQEAWVNGCLQLTTKPFGVIPNTGSYDARYTIYLSDSALLCNVEHGGRKSLDLPSFGRPDIDTTIHHSGSGVLAIKDSIQGKNIILQQTGRGKFRLGSLAASGNCTLEQSASGDGECGDITAGHFVAIKNSNSGHLTFKNATGASVALEQSGSGDVRCGTLFGTGRVCISLKNSGHLKCHALQGSGFVIKQHGPGDVTLYEADVKGHVACSITNTSRGHFRCKKWQSRLADVTTTQEGPGDITFDSLAVKNLKINTTNQGHFAAETIDAQNLTVDQRGSGDVTVSEVDVKGDAASTITNTRRGHFRCKKWQSRLADLITVQEGSGDIRFDSLQVKNLNINKTNRGHFESGAIDALNLTVDQSGSGDTTCNAVSVNEHVDLTNTNRGHIILKGRAKSCTVAKSGHGRCEVDELYTNKPKGYAIRKR